MAHIATIIVFCVFLINIQANTHVKTRHATEHHKTRSHENTGEKENCTCVEESEDLKVIYNKASGIVGIYNSQESVGLIVDTKDNRALIFNSKSHIIIIVNLKDQSAVLIRNSRLKTIFKYLITLKSLKAIEQANKKDGKSFNIGSVPDEVSKQLAPLLKGLSPNYSSISDLTVDVQTLQNAFSNFSQVFGSGSGEFDGDFSSLAQRLKGLVGLIGKIDKNSLSQKKIKINLGEFLRQRTGLESFVDAVRQLSGSWNVSQLSVSNANSDQQLLALISGFGSNANRFDRVWQVVSQLYSFAQSNSSSNSSQTSQQLVRNLTYFFGKQSSSSIQTQQWQSVIINVIRQVDSSNSVPGLPDLLRNLNRQQGFTVNGIDLSTVINELLSLNPLGLIFNIVKILVTLVSDLLKVVAELIVALIELLLLPNHILRIRNFFPNISDSQIDSISGSGDNAPEAQLRGLIRQFNFFDGWAEFWTDIPILGLFLGPLNEALAIATKNKITLSNVFESEESRSIIREGVLNIVNRESSGDGPQIVNPIQQTLEGVVNNLEGVVGQGTNQTVSQLGPILSEKHHGKNANLQKERYHFIGKHRKHERHHD